MMQRLKTGIRPPSEHIVINIPRELPESAIPRRRNDSDCFLLSFLLRRLFRRHLEVPRSQSRSASGKWIHAIPVLVSLLFLTFWLLSSLTYPALPTKIMDAWHLVQRAPLPDLEKTIMDALHLVQRAPVRRAPLPGIEAHLELAVLATATQPSAPVPQDLEGNKVTEALTGIIGMESAPD